MFLHKIEGIRDPKSPLFTYYICNSMCVQGDVTRTLSFAKHQFLNENANTNGEFALITNTHIAREYDVRDEAMSSQSGYGVSLCDDNIVSVNLNILDSKPKNQGQSAPNKNYNGSSNNQRNYNDDRYASKRPRESYESNTGNRNSDNGRAFNPASVFSTHDFCVPASYQSEHYPS